MKKIYFKESVFTLFKVEERRLLLEKYLQLLSQDPRVISSLSFNGFLLGAQQETNQVFTMDYFTSGFFFK